MTCGRELIVWQVKRPLTSDLSRNLPKTGRLLVNIQFHLMKQRVSDEFSLIAYFIFGSKRGRMRDWKYV